jgi:hypothetical protein
VILSDNAMKILQQVMKLDVVGERSESGGWVCTLFKTTYDDFMDLAPPGMTDFSEFIVAVMAIFEAEGFGEKWREMIDQSRKRNLQ